MDKERSEWVKKYMVDRRCTKQAAYNAWYDNQRRLESQVEKSTKSKANAQEGQPIPKSQPEKSIKTQPEILKSQITCPTCKGSGKVPISSKPKERELTELPRLLPRRL